VDQIESTNVFLMRIPVGSTVEQIIDILELDPDVEWAEANLIVTLVETEQRSPVFIDQRSPVFIDGSSPGDYFDQQVLDRIRVKPAHEISTGQGAIVAVIDTGIDPTHPALKDRLLLPRGRILDFVDNDVDPSETCPRDPKDAPACGHGTFVAGIISLVAPNARILPLRAFNAEGQGTTFDIAKATTYAAGRASVINMSFGMSGSSFVLRDAISRVWNRALLVASAGNGGEAARHYPASDERVIAVAATDADDRKADFSNYGEHIDVSAPGVGIYSAYPGNRFGTWSGTSFSTAFVSGQAALLFSVTLTGRWLPATGCTGIFVPNPRLCTANQVTRDSAVNIDSNNPAFAGLLGKGRIDARAAVEQVRR
jgi:thermitase